MYKYGCEYEVRIFSFHLVSFRQTQSHGWCGRNGKDLYSDTTKKTATSYEVFIYQRKVCFLSLLAKFISSLGKDFLKGSEWCFLTNNLGLVLFKGVKVNCYPPLQPSLPGGLVFEHSLCIVLVLVELLCQ